MSQQQIGGSEMSYPPHQPGLPPLPGPGRPPGPPQAQPPPPFRASEPRVPYPRPDKTPGPGPADRRQPRWTSDVGRCVGMAIVWLVIGTVFVIGVHFRLVRHNNGTTVDSTEVFAAMWLGLLGMLVPLAFIGEKRVDRGVRFDGLVSMFTVSSVLVALMGLIAAVAWKPIIGSEAVPGSVLDELFSTLAAALIIFLFLLTATAVAIAAAIPLAAGAFPRWVSAGICLPVWIIAGIASGFAAIFVFGGPPTLLRLVLWFLAALVSLTVMCLVLVLVQRWRVRYGIIPRGGSQTLRR